MVAILASTNRSTGSIGLEESSIQIQYKFIPPELFTIFSCDYYYLHRFLIR